MLLVHSVSETSESLVGLDHEEIFAELPYLVVLIVVEPITSNRALLGLFSFSSACYVCYVSLRGSPALDSSILGFEICMANLHVHSSWAAVTRRGECRVQGGWNPNPMLDV